MKDRYIVRTRYKDLGTSKFLPANPVQAKDSVKTHIKHDPEQYLDTNASFMHSTQQNSSLHGNSVFKNTSPVTQDIL